MKLKSFCKGKDSINWARQQPTEWQNIFTKFVSQNGLISRIYKELEEMVIKEVNKPTENRVYD